MFFLLLFFIGINFGSRLDAFTFINKTNKPIKMPVEVIGCATEYDQLIPGYDEEVRPGNKWKSGCRFNETMDITIPANSTYQTKLNSNNSALTVRNGQLPSSFELAKDVCKANWFAPVFFFKTRDGDVGADIIVAATAVWCFTQLALMHNASKKSFYARRSHFEVTNEDALIASSKVSGLSWRKLDPKQQALLSK